MKKSYLIYALAIIILSLIYTNDNAQQKPNYTRIDADSLFLENDERYITTTNDSFTNQSLKDHITLVFFGYTNCPDFCPDALIKMSALFKSLNKYNDNKKLQLLTAIARWRSMPRKYVNNGDSKIPPIPTIPIRVPVTKPRKSNFINIKLSY